MHPRTLTYGPLAAFLPLLVAALPGQNASVLGAHNASFLESLWRRNYIDEAVKIGDLVAASNLPAAEKAAVDSVYTKLKLALATRDKNPKERRDLVLKTIAEKRAKVEGSPANSEAQLDALGEMVDQYRLLADAMVELLAQESDPAQQASMRKEADQQFEGVEKELKDKAAATDKLRKPDNDASALPYLVSTYGLGKVYYYHALLFPADDYGGKKLVEKSLNVLADFDLDFGDSLAAFEAKLTTALCHNRLGETKTAIEECNDAINLRKRFDQDKSGVWQVDRNAADVIAAAALQKTLLIKDQKDWPKIIETAKDYLTTISKPLEASQGPGVLAAMADAQIELGENDAATKSAQQLMELGGFWAGRGQQLLSRIVGGTGGPIMPVDKRLKLAESLATQGDYDGSLRIFREILLDKSPENAKYASEALWVTGKVFASRQWLHEASVAFDAVVRRYPKSENAPEALWLSIECFSKLYDEEGLPMYNRMVKDRGEQLQRDYPTDQHVGQLQLLDAKRFDRAQKFLEAAALYEKIAKDSSAYLDARYYAANCYQQHAHTLEHTGKTKEAQPFLTKAMEGFRGVLTDTESAKLSTTDAKAKTRLEQVENGARIAIANMLVSGSEPKPAEAEAVLKPITIEDNDKQAPNVWALKIRIQQVQGNLEQAADALAAALEKAPDHKALPAAARSLASALDEKAKERLKANDRLAAEALWRRASTFYLRGASGASTAEVAVMAERLFNIGLILNDVDGKVDSWFELPMQSWKPKFAEPWENALQLYGRLEAEGGANYKTRILQARAQGFLGRFDECEAELQKLFAEERKLATGPNGTMDKGTLAKKPELQQAYLEWGFSLQKASGDAKVHLAKATDVFDRTFKSVKADGKYWWFSRYGLIQSYYDSGRYDEADVSMKSLERTNPEFDEERYGLKRQLTQLKTQIALKIPK
jgi:tetratricopeptide (TPR) repeat protein